MAIDSIEDFLVGLPAIDNEHRMLVDMINRISTEIEEASYELCIKLFDDFEESAISHFRHEEKLFEELGYPSIVGHRTYHDDLILQVRELKGLGYDKVSKEALFRRFVEMADFVVDDILRGDLEFKEFLRRLASD